jgi:hypothetical protein
MICIRMRQMNCEDTDELCSTIQQRIEGQTIGKQHSSARNPRLNECRCRQLYVTSTV